MTRQVACDFCGKTRPDDDGLTRVSRWLTVASDYDYGQKLSWDLCSWACLVDFAGERKGNDR